jgi:hypothetical protein
VEREKEKQKCVLVVSREDHKLCQAILEAIKLFRQVTRLYRQLEEKYFDYNGMTPDCLDNLGKIF